MRGSKSYDRINANKTPELTGDFPYLMKTTAKGKLVLADGDVVEGYSFGALKSMTGEVVFNTGMVGYPESLTDPSYTGQILVLTSPMIGNYGVPSDEKDENGIFKFYEGEKIHIAGLIVADYSVDFSHWNAWKSLSQWLTEAGVPALCGVDTRRLTKRIREQGAVLGKIEFLGLEIEGFEDPNQRNLVAEVSTKVIKTYNKGKSPRIIAFDCGMKLNIVRCLIYDEDVCLTVVPYDYDLAANPANIEYDGIFISNGPGDPTKCSSTIASIKWAMEDAQQVSPKPIFGICLGNQLLALACGAKTYKMKYGNRGMNQPCIDLRTTSCYITSQNHGYAVDAETLPSGWKSLFLNANDLTNEGIIHSSKPFFSAQFHPEAAGGPYDTAFLFRDFIDMVRGEPAQRVLCDPSLYARPQIRKVLLIGSGGLSIGQAGEFDYSGSQAIKALKEEGIEVVLINPNIATVQTSKNLGRASPDVVYFLPVKKDVIIDIIEKERPDGVIVSMGGQTALNVGIELYREGVFEKYGCKVLGTPIDVIIATEDREIFSRKLKEINETLAISQSALNIDEAVRVAKEIGFPVLVRAAYALGGLGSGFADNEEELRELAAKAFALSDQILVDQDLRGWKEIEYEVVRDCRDNCITVCNMENFDPLGVHTGDSIVIAPSQTLSNREYHMLRDTAIKVVRHLGVVGECNIQYALDPHSLDYCIIEVNARLSRSSALASKATGYPLAFVAAKIAMGVTLPEIVNSVTGVTQACFEPSLDYVVTKMPRWDLSKFEGVSQLIGTSMKSVGEVMAIGRTWEESIQKAVRMVDPNTKGFQAKGAVLSREAVLSELEKPTDKRIFAIAQMLESGDMTPEEITKHTNIDPWFIARLAKISKYGNEKRGQELTAFTDKEMLAGKQLGFSDVQIADLLMKGGEKVTEAEVRQQRLNANIKPFSKQIDTLAAEYPAQTNYLYMTYHASEDDVAGDSKSTIVLGSGSYRIGSSVEFDWCGVSTIRALRQMGHRSTMINYNPETVSTDYDECDQLYFEELSKERVMDIYQKENAVGVVVSMGGQIPNNLALPLHHAGIKCLGTCPMQIDRAEDREKFSRIIDDLGLQQAAWRELADVTSALLFADKVGYPVLVRPSYVLSGAAMNVAYNSDRLAEYLMEATGVSPDHPVVISKFILGGREIEMDGIGKDGVIMGCAIHEHVENAGVHSGDATLMLPTQTVSEYTLARIEAATIKIVKELHITGPFNIQYICKDSDVLVIECNLRASRSFPFVSKTMGVDFIEAANRHPQQPSGYVGVKAPMFSFTRLGGADPVLGVEMASTGEVACFGIDKHEAFLKALVSTGFKIPQKKIAVTVPKDLLEEVVHHVWILHELGYELYATAETYPYLQMKNIPCTLMHYANSEETPNVKSMIANKEIDLVVNLPTSSSVELKNNFLTRRTAVDYGVPLLNNAQLFKMFAEALKKEREGKLQFTEAASLFDYYAKEKPNETWTSPTEFH
eukprot:CAMPEP_0173372484 /NCGR_PEP_ID=MMETSP1144-20121109/27924_1 /TAXON_ID=483371 /ORGANISM="non described non described, Strain CCMP2298" /LENGTH=1487 /DNA_ID=CAMNT_0014324465 /DNA_START=113 /DNA_END=4577 /DNA_ORIENTATION=+